MLRVATWLAIALRIQAQSGVVRPEFSPYQIAPSAGGAGGWLWPGVLFSIYGRNLGPQQPCVRAVDFYQAKGSNTPEAYTLAQLILPKQLCGVEVLIDEEAVPLLYVQERQINFLVPHGDRSGRKVALRVTRGGISSVPVFVKFGPDNVRIWQQEAAYTGMPVWIRVQNATDANRPVALPFGIARIWSPRECPKIEVMFNGVLLPELKTKSPPGRIAYSGPPCPSPSLPDRRSLAGRIPLHLRYRFDQPGIYFVRYVSGKGYVELRPTTGDSQWTPIQVQAGTEEQRRKWLKARAATVPSDREELIYDVLPSIFGFGDAAALNIAVKYLHHPDAAVCQTTAAYLRDYYARSVLIAAVEQAVKRRGTNRNVEQLLRDLAAKRSAR